MLQKLRKQAYLLFIKWGQYLILLTSVSLKNSHCDEQGLCLTCTSLQEAMNSTTRQQIIAHYCQALYISHN